MLFGGWNIPNQPAGQRTGQERMPSMSKGQLDPLKKKGDIRSMIEHSMENKDPQKPPLGGMNMPSKQPGENAGSSISGMNYNYWTINGKSFPDTTPFEVKEGELVRIRLANISNGIHPMHLHRPDFRMIAKDGHALKNPLIVNTAR